MYKIFTLFLVLFAGMTYAAEPKTLPNTDNADDAPLSDSEKASIEKKWNAFCASPSDPKHLSLCVQIRQVCEEDGVYSNSCGNNRQFILGKYN